MRVLEIIEICAPKEFRQKFKWCNIDTNQGDKMSFYCSILVLQYSLKKSGIGSKLTEIHCVKKSLNFTLRAQHCQTQNRCHSISFHLIHIFFYFYSRSGCALNSYITFTCIVSKLRERNKNYTFENFGL